MNSIHYQWIETDEQLEQICLQARKQQIIALDTEFVRTRTYYAKLGLIQLYDGQQVSLIDPIKIDNFSPFIDLLADQCVLKVLHACSEDLEVFQHYFQQLPVPMLDTQIMAGFAGIGISVGFAKLVEHFLSISLDKGASRTDWLARPLTEIQCQYAAADVWYLLPIYHKLSALIEESGWQKAVREESESLCNKIAQPVDLNNAYKEISNAWQLKPAQLAVLQVLAKWRIEEAQKRDLALNFVVKETHLWHIAKIQPKHTSNLLEFMHPNEVRIHGKKLLWLVEQGRAIPADHHPNPIVRLVDLPGYKRIIKALQQKLKIICPENLSPELLAGKRQLNQLFGWYQKGQSEQRMPDLLKGWRTEFGQQLLSILEEDEQLSE